LRTIPKALPHNKKKLLQLNWILLAEGPLRKKKNNERSKEHAGPIVVSVAVNALPLYPDRTFNIGNLYGRGI